MTQPMGSDTMWWRWGTHGSTSNRCSSPSAHQSWGIFWGHLRWPLVAQREAESGHGLKTGPWGAGTAGEGVGTSPGRAAGWGKHKVGGSRDVGGTRHCPGSRPVLTRAGVRRQLPLLQLPLLRDAGSLPTLAAGLRLASGEGTVCTGRQHGWHRWRGCARPTLPIAERWGEHVGDAQGCQALAPLLVEKLPKFGRTCMPRGLCSADAQALDFGGQGPTPAPRHWGAQAVP